MQDRPVALKADNIHFGYDKTEILHGVSFEVSEGDFLFLLGPNGSGKTTLFKCLLGLYRPGQGSITIDGENIHNMTPAALAKKIAYIPQAHHPSFNYTVLDAVTMGRTAYIRHNSAPTEEDRAIAAQALETLGISYLRDKGYARISGGERQMVLIARALTQQSRILVMDEPTSSLDYGHQVKVLSAVKRLAEEGYTVIISSHNPEHAFQYGSKVLMIKNGTKITMGDPHSVLTRDLLQNIYEVPMDLLTVRRDEEDGREYKVCVPVL